MVGRSFRGLFASRPRRILVITLLVIVVLCAGTYAYWTFLPPQQGPRAATLSSPLELSIQLDKCEYQQGENVTITISLKNVGNETITVSWPSYSCSDGVDMYFDFIVMDGNGTKVSQWYYGRGLLASVLTRTLDPGQQLTNVYTWMQDTGWPDFAQVPKGTYSVKGLSRGFDLTVGTQLTSMELETPTITFIIT
jgi:hypothetical protein